MAEPVALALEPVGEATAAANLAWARALFAGLVAGGVREVCLCPGSRSTPLVVAASREPALCVRAHLDERAAGFFALGLARASRRPVALVCTSGTAAGNFLPAVMEAHWARVPLVVLTADRPPELRDCGAGQTVDQLRLYGAHARWFAEAPTPVPGVALAPAARALGLRAAEAARGRPAGVAHLNLPFREPLEPPACDRLAAPASAPVDPASTTALRLRRGHDLARVAASSPGPARPAPPPTDDATDALAEWLRSEPHGVVVCGPMDEPSPLAHGIARLARVLGWPLLAEPTSQLRSGPHEAGAPLVAHHDAFLRDADFARAHAPRCVLRFGDTPTSKPLRGWLDASPQATRLLVDPDGVRHDPGFRCDARLEVEPAPLVSALLRRLEERPPPAADPGWEAAFLRADRRAARTLDTLLALEPRLLAPAVVRRLARALPAGATLFVSNSMAVRDVDAFWPRSSRRLRVLANRGANGIDGIVSSALGASLGAPGPTVLLTGDLAFLHDVGGLFAAHHLGLSLTIVVLHDDGGGIFSLLPIAQQGEAVRFRQHFRLAHGLELAPAAAMYGLSHARVTDGEAFSCALEEALVTPGGHVIEARIDAEANAVHHRALFRAVGAAVSGGGRIAEGA